MRELTELLERAGHADFRDARGPMRFSQRQAGGKFTRDEAQGFIDRLEEDEAQENAAPPPSEPVAATPPEAELALRDFSAEDLAAELRRRGWIVGDD